MRLAQVGLSNFGLFSGQQKVSLSVDDNFICILGDNRDESGSSSNGSGKSTLPLAVVWALTGWTPKNVSEDDLIHVGLDGEKAKEMRVDVVMEPEGYFISRYRKRRASSEVHAFQRADDGSWKSVLWPATDVDPLPAGDPVLTDLPAVPVPGKKSQEVFAGWLGVPESLIRFMLYCRQGEAEYIFSLPPKERMKAFGSIFGFDVWDTATESARKQMKAVELELSRFQGKLDTLKAQVEEYAEYSRTETIDRLEAQIADMKSEIDAKESEQAELSEKYGKLRADLSAMTALKSQLPGLRADYASTVEKIEELEQTLKRVTAEIEDYPEVDDMRLKEVDKRLFELGAAKTDLFSEIAKVEAGLEAELSTVKKWSKMMGFTPLPKTFHEFEQLMAEASEVVCVTCKRPWDKTKVLENVQELSATYSDLDAKLGGLRDSEKTLREEFEQLSKEKVEIETLARNLASLENRQFDIGEKIEDQASALERINRRGKELSAQLSELPEVDEDLIAAVKTESDEVGARVRELKRVLGMTEAELALYSERHGRYEKYSAEYAALTSGDEYASLEDEHKILSWVVGSRTELGAFARCRLWQIDLILPKIEADANAYLASLDTRLRVQLRADSDSLELDVLDGELRRNWNQYSGGNKKRVIMALLSAIKSDKFGFRLLDEPFSDVDTLGLERLSEALSRDTDTQKVVISHRKEVASFADSSIIIIREGGSSRAS